MQDSLNRVWWAVYSVGQALLWQIRNQVVHEGNQWSQQAQLEYMWTSTLRQLTAVARREQIRPQTRIQGLLLQLCIDCFTSMTAVRKNRTRLRAWLQDRHRGGNRQSPS
ncbi:hypothetical protein JG688_00009207 [Phytophthora aleatoria]|uniref:Uncharacterized protein n=1 Tax=Phytophthora aleatoria TaxID=2496075 RepID=A0A8J5ILU3_9STRA|nr:hypothetical protein JG688_00009207 [Phytophthora aleatoria]